MRLDVVTRDLRHNFDTKERIRLAEDLSHEILTRDEACRLFASAKKAHDEKVGQMESAIRDLGRKLCEGWEYRDIKCKLLWNDPKDGEKTFMRIDTGEIVAVEPMTDAEKQEPLPLAG